MSSASSVTKIEEDDKVVKKVQKRRKQKFNQSERNWSPSMKEEKRKNVKAGGKSMTNIEIKKTNA